MVEKIKEILAETLYVDKDDITLTASFTDDLGADSLDLYEAALSLGDEYDVEFEPEDLENVDTLQDLLDLLDKMGINGLS